MLDFIFVLVLVFFSLFFSFFVFVLFFLVFVFVFSCFRSCSFLSCACARSFLCLCLCLCFFLFLFFSLLFSVCSCWFSALVVCRATGCASMRGVVACEPPHHAIYEFKARVEVTGDEAASARTEPAAAARCIFAQYAMGTGASHLLVRVFALRVLLN